MKRYQFMRGSVLTWMTAALLALACCSCSVSRNSLLVEAEFFDDKGGWVLDEQFYEQVGSAYLLAHGAGKPVADATTSVTFPSKGRYHVWARTYNWNAPWDSTMAPGTFQILSEGNVVGGTLGDVPTSWDWQYAGALKAGKDPVRLALHDLTGFEGRCDALYFSKDRKAAMPSEREIETVVSPDEYDLIVAGGGYSGISAAVAAARNGLKVLLLDNKRHAGGNSSPEIRIKASGRGHEGLYPNLGNVLGEYGIAFEDYDAFEKKLRAEENLTVLLAHRIVGVETDAGRIRSVTALDFDGRRKVTFKGRLFADCTGDANLGALAGAEYMTGQETRDVYGEGLAPVEPENRSYGSTLKWQSVKTKTATAFPETPWAQHFTDSTARRVKTFKWFWEAGFGRDQIADAEWIRDYMFRVIYGNWSHLKNSPATRKDFARYELTPEGVSTTLGKRESRRLKGDLVFTENDIYGGWKNYPDAAVIATYPIDQHFPSPEMTKLFPGEEFESTMRHNYNPLGVSRSLLKEGVDYPEPYMIPYRCLYSVNIDNMFMAGRDISGSRIALCSYRVAGTGALMGEVVGLAAVVCNKYGCTPREVYTTRWSDLKTLLEKGVPSKHEQIYVAN